MPLSSHVRQSVPTRQLRRLRILSGTVMVVACLVATSACSENSLISVEGAARPVANFVLAKSGGSLSVLADGLWEAVRQNDAESLAQVQRAIAVDVDHVAFVAAKSLTVVSRDGEVRSATVDSSCSSLASDQTRIAVLCDEAGQGRAPTIRIFARNAEETARVIVQRRNADGLFEATLKEYVVDEHGKKWLWPRSYDPEHQSPVQYKGGNEVTITGVMASFIVEALR